MSAPTLREALTEIRGRLNCHPAYAYLTEAEEEDIGGDTAEFSYLVRVADDALAQPDPFELVANLLSEYGLQALEVAAAFKAHQDEPVTPVGWLYDWIHSSATGRQDEHFTGFSADEAGARRNPAHTNIRPVFAAPQSAPVAQPLTDEQIQEISEDHANSFMHGGVLFDEFDYRGFARAIERSHKIGGPL